MSMYRLILVPLDGSKRSERILPYVEQIALQCESAVVLLLIIEPPPGTIVHDGVLEVMLHNKQHRQRADQAREYLEERADKLRAREIACHTRVNYGQVVREILSVAEQESADMIAIASHGRTALSQLYHGSVTTDLLHRTDLPLLLIRYQTND